MSDDILTGTLLEDSWLTLEQAAAACAVEPEWLMIRLEAGLFTHAECAAGVWRLSAVALRRARRMRALERDFDAVPELAALVADMEEEIGVLRQRLALLGD
ncbi:MAG: MerR family transcriptional regulator [Zoogloeaceae bacterium]|nr:MerR family transcriptional regulator [Zoogloeaceae bacterium]